MNKTRILAIEEIVEAQNPDLVTFKDGNKTRIVDFSQLSIQHLERIAAGENIVSVVNDYESHKQPIL